MRTAITIVLFALLATLVATAAGQTLEIYCVNVDQGDATVIVSPSGQSLLVDGGDNGRGYGVVVPLLNGLKLARLTHMVATHYHADHIGGLDEVIQSGFRPTTAWDRGTFGGVPTTQSYQDYARAVASVRRTITPGTIIDLGAGVTAECVAVNGQIKGAGSVPITGSSHFENAASIGLHVRYGSFDFFVGGDITGGGTGSPDVEGALARVAGDMDVVQVNHNGSNTSTHYPLLHGLSPEVSLISCGADNPYGHPHYEVLDRLNSLPITAAIYQTTEGCRKPGGIWVKGTIRIRVSGSHYVVDGGVLTPRTFFVDETLPPTPFPLQAGELVIAEFLANPSRVDDAMGEYVEIRNTTTRTLDLVGCTLRDEGQDAVPIVQSVPVPAGEAVVIGRMVDPLRNGGFVPDLVVSEFYLSNSDDEIRLDDAWGNALDVVRYVASSFPVVNGAAAERIQLAGPGTSGNFRTAITTFGDGDRGTPGNPNAADPGYPAHVALVAGRPVIGQGLTLRLAGPAGKTHFLVLSTTRSAISLPGHATLGVGLDLLPFSFLLPNWIGNLGNGVVSAGLAVPAEPALRGQTFYLQLVLIDGQGLAESTSDVVRLKIG